jgi:hypothetical protein
MYLHLGKGAVVPKAEVVAIFDLDNASYSHITREYLARAEREGRVVADCDDLPKSFVVTDERVYLSQLGSATLLSRWRET